MKKRLLQEAYCKERARLTALSEGDYLEGEYVHPVFGEGDPDAPVLLIGEAPGAEETRLSRPFVGKAGKQLDALLPCAGLERSALYITNTVKYRPIVRSIKTVRNRTPERAEVIASLPLLQEEIHILAPQLIVTLGNTPLKALFLLSGEKPPVIGDAHGRPIPVRISGYEYTIFALYHPASGIYNRNLVGVMRVDAALLGEHLVKRDTFHQTKGIV